MKIILIILLIILGLFPFVLIGIVLLKSIKNKLNLKRKNKENKEAFSPEK